MNRPKKIIAATALTMGIGAGAIIFTPIGSNAANNVVLASVDWVNTKINPLNTRVSALESKISSLEEKLTAQQQQITSLKAGNGSTTPSTPTTPASPSTPTTPTTPEKPGLPSEVYVNVSSAKVHSGASTAYKVLATMSKGDSLTVIDTFTAATGLWYRVSLSSTVKGWINSSNVSTTEVTVTNPTSVVTTGTVNIRKGASIDYPIVDTIQMGLSLKYIQSFTNTLGQTWYNVETSSGKRGWISSSLGEVK